MIRFKTSIIILSIIYALPAIILTISGSEFITIDAKHSILYAIWCISIISVPIVISSTIYQIYRHIGLAVLALFRFIVLLISLITTYLAIFYHSSINYNIISLITGTNCSEALEFITTYIINKNTIILTLLFLTIYMVDIILIKYLRHIKFIRSKKLNIIFIIICLFLSFCVPIQIIHFNYFTSNSSKNINKLREDNSLMLYDPICCLYNSLLQFKKNEKDFEICYTKCDIEKVTITNNEPKKIILIIGESHNKYHSSLYGYSMHTNPLLEKDSVIVFNDAISPRQITSHSLKAFMSYADYGEAEKWYEHSLFPAILKRNGYNITFYSNEFPFYGENSPWNSEAGFLTDGKISKKLFSNQNDYMYKYDEQLISEFEKKRDTYENGKLNLIIFQLRGQHFTAKDRFPSDYARFHTRDYYKRIKLTKSEKQEIADYDNACLYNDYIIHRIISMYKEHDAIVIYFSDHGEEANDYRAHTGRDFGKLTADGIHCLLDIPFFIYITKKYEQNHPNICKLIKEAKNRPFTIDHLPHFISHITGVYTKEYDKRKDFIHPLYNIRTKRTVLENLNYDSLVSNYTTFKISYGY